MITKDRLNQIQMEINIDPKYINNCELCEIIDYVTATHNYKILPVIETLNDLLAMYFMDQDDVNDILYHTRFLPNVRTEIFINKALSFKSVDRTLFTNKEIKKYNIGGESSLKVFKSNCLIEAIKAKIKNPKIKIITILPPIGSLSLHFMWSDGLHDIDFGTEIRVGGINLLRFNGEIRERKLGFALKLKKSRKLAWVKFIKRNYF